MNCETCAERRKQAEPVPYIVHEGELARMERSNKRWFVAWLITFVLLISGIVFFFVYEAQFETFKYTVTQENDRGLNNYIGGEGSIYNGEEAFWLYEESDADCDGDGPEA